MSDQENVKPISKTATVEESYKDIIVQDQKQNSARATAIAILPEEAKSELVEASKYSSYFPNPITKPFMRKYILSKLEFPTKESELAQSMTEMNVRLDNLFNDAYSYEKAELELEGIQIEIDELEDTSESKFTEGSTGERRRQNQIALKKLELKNKEISLNKIKLAAMARYNEFVNWKGCVEDIMKEIGVKSLDEINFNQIRMGEMEGKIKRWGELQAQGMLEMTPSKFQAIDSNMDSFAKGVQKGQAQIAHQQHSAESQKLFMEAQALLADPTKKAEADKLMEESKQHYQAAQEAALFVQTIDGNNKVVALPKK